jgi:hypothetical protein
MKCSDEFELNEKRKKQRGGRNGTRHRNKADLKQLKL